MASIRIIKRRIRTAKNIAQITKAMELVAASKMRKAQALALSGKLYANKIYEMVMRLSEKVDLAHHPLLAKPVAPRGNRLVILISTNKGLCGGLNTQVFRFLMTKYPKLSDHTFVTLGKKGAEFLARMGAPVTADFSDSVPFGGSVPAVVNLAITQFLSHTFGAVDLLYNEFVSALTQSPRRKTILPLTLEGEAISKTRELTYTIEPDIATAFDLLLPHYIENQVRDAILQAEASEHSARMVAMRSATDNALSLTDELTLLYNRARQEKVTYEITDMVTARLAVE